MDVPVDSLSHASTRLTKQFLNRYGAAMFRKLCGEASQYATELSACFLRAGLTGVEVGALQSWLVSGVKAFAEFPPSFEMMVQMGKLLKNFPATPAQLENLDFWAKVDGVFSQNYGRFWKIDGIIDGLERERLWLTTFTEMEATPSELTAALAKIRSCIAFRSYPPSLEQFQGAIISIRAGDCPLVEDAWLLAISMKPGQVMHPFVKRARGTIGAFELNIGERDRATEHRFKKAYLDLLKNPPEMGSEPEQPEEIPERQYLDPASILSSL